MAATNGCEAWTVWSAGFIIAGYGYSPAFILMSIVSLASLLLLKKIKLD